MLVNRIAFFTITAILMFTFLILRINPFIAGIATLAMVMTGYIIIAYIRSKGRLDLLEKNCDPEAFLQRTERQRAITGKNPKLNEYLNIDKAAGLITSGRFEEARTVLLSVDKSRLSAKNGTLLAYNLNLILCLFELGDFPAAEKIFETQLPVLPPIGPVMVLAVKFTVAERLFFTGKYEEARKCYNELLNEKISKRIRMDVLYRLAQLDEKAGEYEAAKTKYSEVAAQGNKLWIAEQAGNRLKCL